HFFNDENFVAQFIASGIDAVIISLDGADPETYASYRIGGDFDRVLRGIERLVSVRKRLKSTTPRIFMQCLVTRNNERQLDQMKKLAKKLEVDRLLFKTFQFESKESAHCFLPTRLEWRRYRITAEGATIKNHRRKGCARLWYSTVVLSDGRVVPCCFDKNGHFDVGRIEKSVSFNQIWKSNTYHEFRKQVLRGSDFIGICHNCTQNQKVYL
ncbi:MAG TPA: SPASM domain-containing protein, partial [bacterium]